MLENLIDNEQAKMKPYSEVLEAKTLEELQAMVESTNAMKLDKRWGKKKIVTLLIEYYNKFGYPENPEYIPNPTAGLAELPQVKPADPRPLHPVLQARDFKKEQEEELARNLEERRVRLESVERQSQKLDTEFLDAIARAFQGKPNPAYDEAFPAKLISVCMMLVNIFDDGNDVIIQAKLGDQLPRMFEKMRDNVKEAGLKLDALLKAEQRGSNNTEINLNKIEDLQEKIQKHRQQWAILNNAFVICRDQLRPKVLGQTGMGGSWGQYKTLEQMATENRRKANDRELNLDNLMNNRELFNNRLSDRHEDFGLVSVPDGE